MVNRRTVRNSWAHPRVSGENAIQAAAAAAWEGSSPRERGKREVAQIMGVNVGLIPA